MKNPPEPKIKIPAREHKLQILDPKVIVGPEEEKKTEEKINVSPKRATKRI